MSLSSHQNEGFDTRLVEIEELYRQRKPELAAERVSTLKAEGAAFEGYALGLWRLLEARERFEAEDYKTSIRLSEEANRLLASSAYHKRVGLLLLLLYKNHSSLGEMKKAEEYAHEAYASFKRIGDREGMVDALNGLGKISFYRGDYAKAGEFVNDSIDLSKGDNVRLTRLIGNLGRIETLCGNWETAEKHLKTALALARELKEVKLSSSMAINHLSLGYLYMRQRLFTLATRELKSASLIISESSLRREEVIYLEYEGELAMEMGDIVRAKKLLTQALELGREIAPESTLVSQITRRLAQVEFSLDNLDESLKSAQKALDLATRLGERAEIGLCQIAIAEVFAARGDFDLAVDYCQDGLDLLRKIGDPYDLARALLAVTAIYIKAKSVNHSRINKKFDEAFRLFNNLRLFYWSGEVRLRQGIFACENGRVSSGFRSLHESEKIFEKVAERTKIRAIQLFLQELSRQAVEYSLSSQNEYKLFGNYFNDQEYSELKSGDLIELLRLMGKRAGADRVLVYSYGQNGGDIITPLSYTPHQCKKFQQQFMDLLGEEFHREKPTLLFDTRRDPFINELLPSETGKVVASVLVAPLKLRGEITGYLYIDRMAANGNILPFGQGELNFTVGFADLIALKLAEHDRLVLEEDNRRLKAQILEEAAFPNIITQNKPMLEMLARVRQVVDSDISISIEGETGCGKDLLAKAIHYGSNRRDKRFISVNCAALPESLLESELFGHKKGAFTGADREKAGLFEEADGGTFFLDEIADMPMSIQAKVLRVLEEKEIVRLGDTHPIKVDVRILSATNKELKIEMEGGRFRQDLYYRLTALCFKIPPLRERKEDVPLLISHFAANRARFTPEALRAMINFDWPGNVRELENEIKKLILLAGDKGIIDLNLLSAKVIETRENEKAPDFNLDTAVAFNDQFSLYDYLAEYEKRFIIRALRDQGGVKKHAAASLNIPESTLRLKIKQYNIDLGSFGAVN